MATTQRASLGSASLCNVVEELLDKSAGLNWLAAQVLLLSLAHERLQERQLLLDFRKTKSALRDVVPLGARLVFDDWVCDADNRKYLRLIDEWPAAVLFAAVTVDYKLRSGAIICLVGLNLLP